MTGELHAVADPNGLWASLSTFEIGSNPRGFERRLAAEQGWSEAYACRVTGEYRRFLYLASVATFEVTPSKAVDAAWHLHLEDEAHYREALCGRLFGRIIEHRPGSGDALEEERFREQYRRTLDLYESVFGAPPAYIWPQPSDTEDEHEVTGSGDRRWILAGLVIMAGTVLAAFFDPAAIYIGVGLLAALAICFAITRFSRPRSKSGAAGQCGGCGGGGACSGTADHSGPGDSAGCGGGCGGD